MKIFINNPFPLPLLKQETSVRCLDLSTRWVETNKGKSWMIVLFSWPATACPTCVPNALSMMLAFFADDLVRKEES